MAFLCLLGSALSGVKVHSRSPKQSKSVKLSLAFVPKPRKLQKFLVDALPSECDLNVEVYPMFYVPLLRSSSVKIAFDSNCLQRQELTFEAFYNSTSIVNWNYNPTKLNLLLWGNWYRFSFSRPSMIDRFDVMRSLRYNRVSVMNLRKVAKNVSLRFRNQVFLDPQRRKTFTPENLAKLTGAVDQVLCSMRPRFVRNHVNLRKERRERLKAREKQGLPPPSPFDLEHLPTQPLSRSRKLREQKLVERALSNIRNSTLADALERPPTPKEEAKIRKQVRAVIKKKLAKRFIRDLELFCRIK